jgi:hypothetical protein
MWFLSFEIENKPKVELQSILPDKQIGIDLNASKGNLIVLSNRTKRNNPLFYQEAEKQLSELATKLFLKKHRRNKTRNGWKKARRVFFDS